MFMRLLVPLSLCLPIVSAPLHCLSHCMFTNVCSHFTGVKSLLEDEIIRVGGSNHSHATQDLYDAIAAGDYPEWKLFIQTMEPADQDK